MTVNYSMHVLILIFKVIIFFFHINQPGQKLFFWQSHPWIGNDLLLDPEHSNNVAAWISISAVYTSPVVRFSFRLSFYVFTMRFPSIFLLAWSRRDTFRLGIAEWYWRMVSWCMSQRKWLFWFTTSTNIPVHYWVHILSSHYR